jgi:hypothetical protein
MGRIGAAAAVERVIAFDSFQEVIVRLAAEHVVAGLAFYIIIAGSAYDVVIVILALEEVIAILSKERVIAGAAPQVVPAAPSADDVIPAEAVNPFRVVRTDHDIVAFGTLQEIAVYLAVHWAAEDVVRAIHVNRGRLPITRIGHCRYRFSRHDE